MGKINKSGVSATVLKALGIFGSLEALKLLCSVVRTKLVALWIGTAGVGVISLYTATIELIKSVALLNMRQSAVPAIASASESDKEHICRSVDLLGLIIGIFVTIFVLALSPVLSLITFGTYDYSWGFALLAPTMLAYAVTDARQAIFQGLAKLRVLAISSLYAVLASTAVAIPMFYFFRMAAIVPVLIVFPLFGALFMFITPGTRLKYPGYDKELFRTTVRTLVRLGSYLTAGLSMGFAADYILRIFLETEGGIDTVGTFQAGYTIVKSYIGLFFTAITMEFFPRLSASVNRSRYTSVIVGHEIILALGILAPVVVTFISFDRLIVELLYSSAFTDVVPYMSVAVIGTLLRAVSWCFSYVIIAKGDGRVYILTEGISAVSLLVFSYIGWKCGGYAGLGAAYVGQFILFTAATWGVCRVRYGIRVPRMTGYLTIGTLIIGAAALVLKIFIGWWAPLIILPAAAYPLFKTLR